MSCANSRAEWRRMNVISRFLQITCLFLISAMSSGVSSCGREVAVQGRVGVKKGETVNGAKLLSLSRKVGATTYKVNSVSACGISMLEVPPGTYLVTVDMQFCNGSRRKVRVSPRKFEIRTDDGSRLQSGTGEDIVLRGGQCASSRLLFGLTKGQLYSHPKLVCHQKNVSFDLPEENLLPLKD